MGSYKRGSGTSPDVHSKWSHLVLIVVEYFGQQRSLNRGCVRTLKKEWVILHGSSMICTIISGSLPDTEPVDVSEASLTDWCWVTAWRLSLLSWLRMACFAFLRCTFGSSVYCWGWKQWHWCFEPGKIHCWTVEILGGKSCRRQGCHVEKHRRQKLIR